MKKIALRVLALVSVGFIIAGIIFTRDGSLETPVGKGTVSLAAGDYEAFPLPDYAAKLLNDDYKSYFVEVAPGIKIHVLEIGIGYPVYMQHGVPTSGFLYRKVADSLPQDQFRIIMPTLVGLGFSSKVPASQHTIENHITWLHSLLNELELSELIFIGQDWGGPLGAGALERSPELLKGMIALNTVLDAPKEPRAIPAILKALKTPVLGEFMAERSTSLFSQLPNFQNDPETLPPDVLDVYARPVEEGGNAKGPLALIRMAVFDPEHPDAAQLRTIENYLSTQDMPVEIVWGMNDQRLGDRLINMRSVFPNAAVVETEAGHFLQEEVPADIAAAVHRIRKQIRSN